MTIGSGARSGRWAARALLSLCVLPVGCGTLLDMHRGELGQSIYGGVRSTFKHCLTYGLYALIAPIDVPLCVIADTLFLPITVPLWFHRRPDDGE